jgi:hypothetical protein
MDASQHPQPPADAEPRVCPLPVGPGLALEGPGAARLALMVGTVLERLTAVDDPGRPADA